ncbi:hypothetical protein LJB42_001813 [Komagataella kurtzmanii]|nr:hypothetical protein LJB42_001813 [Komagataella kurtzmanii]
MLHVVQLDDFATRLNAAEDYQSKHSVLSEICDSLETFNAAQDYEYFLKSLIPLFIDVLKEVPVSFVANSPENKLRNITLEILHRIPANDALQAYSNEIVDTLMELLKVENELNGILCMKAVTTLHKTFKASLQEKVHPFIDIVIEIYSNIPQVVEEQFNGNQIDSKENVDSTSRPNSPSFSSQSDDSKQLAQAMFSFKTLAESPITMVSLYSSYKELAASSLGNFIPHVMKVLSLEVAKQAEARKAAEEKGIILVNVCKEITNRANYGEFIIGQVKAASFLAYLFIRRQAQTFLEPYQQAIPDIIIRLLQDCPSELSAARKELLHATRHILSTDFRKMFIPKIDLLFDLRVLIGEGFTAYETLRPLAYSTVADFIHNVRDHLTPAQLWKSVSIYCKNLQDDSLALTVQIMSAKLLLNLIEKIMRSESKTESRQLLMVIIDAYTKRFKMLNSRYNGIMKQHATYEKEKQEKQNQERLLTNKLDGTTPSPSDDKKVELIDEDQDVKMEDPTPEISDQETIKGDNDAFTEPQDSEQQLADFMSLQEYLPIQVSVPPEIDLLKDSRYLFKTLMTFLKTIMIGLKNSNPPSSQNHFNAQNWNETARGFSNEDINILKSLFRECILALRFFSTSKTSLPASSMKQSFDITGPNLPITSTKEEKDLMEIFATMFIHIDPASFNEIVREELPFMYKQMLDFASLLHIPQFFLASVITSSSFSGILITFLKSKLVDLGEVNIIKSNILIRLFKLCFMSVSLFPAANESVILPHLNELILKSLKLSTTAKEPLVYFYLIRTLFRSIGGGRFENLYKEIMPLLQVLLESLSKLIHEARRPQERDIYVELCLTVPVRLSVLVPHLSYLMKPLVYALNGSQESVSQGLRTLELCVDNLTAEYFDPIIEPVIDDVMEALSKHLKPLPYYHQHSHTTLRILGKLGGRNRTFIKPVDNLKTDSELFQNVEAMFKIHGLPNEVPLSITPGLSAAFSLLTDPRPRIHYRINSFKYISGIFQLFLGATQLPDDYANRLKESMDIILEDTIAPDEPLNKLHHFPVKDIAKYDSQMELLVKLLESIFYAVSLQEVREESKALIRGTCNHFILLYFNKMVIDKRKFVRKFSVDNHEGNLFLNENCIFDAIIYALSSDNSAVRSMGLESVQLIYDSCVELFGNIDCALKFAPLNVMCSKFIHCCFEEPYHKKLAGCIGLEMMLNSLDIPMKYFNARQLEIIRALFYVLRDTAPELPCEVTNTAKRLILNSLKEWNKELTRNDVFSSVFQNLVSSLVVDLPNANEIVRATAQEALRTLSETTQVPIATMISPCKHILLAPIFGKPLRALPFQMQIGNIDAITFCMGLENSFLEYNEELNRLVQEALALVDAEDESLVSAHRISEHKTSEQLVRLRVVCIQLLSLAITKPEFAAAQQRSNIRVKILVVFFKSLCGRSIEIIRAAHGGLKAVIDLKMKLPKELLQNGLRPMLMNLSDHKKLTVASLEALSGLLKLFISYFKVGIGSKLLDHLLAWAQPRTLQQLGSQDLENNSTVQIIVAILDVFHLLPPTAHKFMNDLMNALLYLENNLHRCQYSPFREPLAKFLDRFPDESFEYFFNEFSKREITTRFVYFVGLDSCSSLRAKVLESLPRVSGLLHQEGSAEERCVRFSNLVDLCESLAASDKEWIKDKEELLGELLDAGSVCLTLKRSSNVVSPLYFQVDQGFETLQLLYIEYFKSQPLGHEKVFNFIDKISKEGLPFVLEFDDFIFNEVVKCQDVPTVQQTLDTIIRMTPQVSSLDARVYLYKRIFLPICIYESEMHGNLSRLSQTENNELPAWLKSFDADVWKATGPLVDDYTSTLEDRYRLELMQLTALLIKGAPTALTDMRKDIIKFSWNYIKLDDNTSKQAAYVVTAYFISRFDTPSELTTRIFVALLRCHQIDTRYLVKQALELLAPVLSERTNSGLDWLKWPRRVLSEDGFNITQVANIYQLMVKFPDLFYPARDHFIPNIITAMGKLTVMSNTSLENQQLAIDLAELILKWETKVPKSEKLGNAEEAENEKSVSEDKMDIDVKEETKEDIAEKPKAEDQIGGDDSVSSNILTSEDYEVSFAQREACVTFLIRYICISTQRPSENELGKRALNILYELLGPKYWSEVTVKLQFFERFLMSSDLNQPSLLGYCLNALEVLAVALKWKPTTWIIENVSYLQKLLEKCLRSDNQDIQEILQKVLGIILEAINKETQGSEEDEPEEVTNFISLIVNIIGEDLSNMTSVAAGVSLCWTLSLYRPNALDSLLPSIMRTFNKLCRDHIAISLQGNQPQSGDFANIEFEAKVTTNLLEKILNLCAARISSLDDQRRVFLSLLAQLIDRSVDKDMLLKVINIVTEWIFKTDFYPTTKEKAGILGKMMIFDLRGEPELSKKFNQVIVDIFESKELAHTELTARMETAFLFGTRLSDVSIRKKLMSILSDSLELDIDKRLFYIIKDQNWEYLSDYPWLNQALQLLYGSFHLDSPIRLSPEENTLSPLQSITEGLAREKSPVEKGPQNIIDFVAKHKEFLDSVRSLTAGDILNPLIDISYQSAETIHNAWVVVFPVAYSAIESRYELEFTRALVKLLFKDYHIRQQDARPNVIKSLLDGVGKCPGLHLPPHLVKYLGSNYNAWYGAIKLLEELSEGQGIDNQKISDANQDALLEVYMSLQEDDMFYGTWRRRAKYFETNAALSYEQIGIWDKALQLYEAAQIKARSGVFPFGESEYSLWEDHWIYCAEKLQHWEILTELAKHEGFTDLLLECGWRGADWIADREPLEQSVKTVMDIPTPRRQIFQTFLALQGFSQQKDTLQDVSRLCDEGIQLTLRKWNALPQRVTRAHIGLLHTFQQYVELMEASQVYSSLVTTNAQNLDVKSQELKRVLQAWRERLPNVWDDINIWNDLVTWRQHVFGVINRVYMPFVPVLQQSNGTNNGNSYAYRGYHEMAWVINRFAHVARKHEMPEVCINQLTKIYTLPNIEIQEAFLKLREQAKCHYQNSSELNTGLDVISNTNLVYFATQQKAEFFTLKGMFLAKLNAKDEANQAFATAVQIDLNLPKAWAEWGFFNDRRFKENPEEIFHAKNAISCYLQAAGLYKDGKTRKLLCRILWLISLDDASGSLAKTFEDHHGESPVWYWITFVPQLLTSLSHKEAKIVRHILIQIAKSYPQSLHFQLRTTKEDYQAIQRQAMAANRAEEQSSNKQDTADNALKNTNTPQPQTRTETSGPTAESDKKPSIPPKEEQASPQPSRPATTQASPQAQSQENGESSQKHPTEIPTTDSRQPWQDVEEIMGILKTAYPLLALSLESLVDQLNQRFKCNADEDAYRLVIVLYNDGVQQMNRVANPREEVKLPAATEASISRFADSVLPKNIREVFEHDIIACNPNLETYISKLRKWRDCLEEKLDRSYGKADLERVSLHLSLFHHQKFEDIEIPGQYLLHKDNNNHFIKIERFLPTLDLVRGSNGCYKRMTIRGNDGSLHPFAVQFPAARHCRREERIFQLFRIFDDALSRKVQSRRRNISLTLPIAVPLSPHIRILNDDKRYTTLMGIYEEFCRRKGQSRDEPFAYTIQKLRAAFDPRLPKPDIVSVRAEVLASIQSTLVPSTLLKDYYTEKFSNYENYWLFRKQFTAQYASFIFMTYIMCINSRQPQKIHINEGSGNIWTSEMLPTKVATGKTHSTAYNNSTLDPAVKAGAPIFYNTESVPFRLTPNIQKFIGEAGLEGILSVYILVIANSLSDSEFDMEQYLSLFVRDEVISWFAQQHRASAQTNQLREIVRVNVELLTKRVLQLNHIPNSQNVATQFVLNLISQAVNPRNLAYTDSAWMAYL